METPEKQGVLRLPPIAVLLATHSIAAAAEPSLPWGELVGRVECVRRMDLRDFGDMVYRDSSCGLPQTASGGVGEFALAGYHSERGPVPGVAIF